MSGPSSERGSGLMKRARRMQRIKRAIMAIGLVLVLGKLGVTVWDTVQRARCQEAGGRWDERARLCEHP